MVAPVNDNFADAIDVDFETGTILGTNVDATTEGADPADLPTGATNANNVWWKFTADTDATVVLTKHDDVVISQDICVWTGTVLGSLTEVADDSTVGLTFAAVDGTTYHLSLGGSGTEGVVGVEMVVAPPPANDNIADATEIVLVDDAYTSAGSLNTGATLEAGEEAALPAIGYTCWWTWTPDEDITVAIDTIGSTGTDADTRVWVYTDGPVFADMVQVAADDDSGHGMAADPDAWPAYIASFDAVAATTYHLRVDGYPTGLTYVLHVGLPTLPPPTTDTSSYGDGRTRDGSADDVSVYPVVPLPAHLTDTSMRIIAVQLPTPTLVDGRPQ